MKSMKGFITLNDMYNDLKSRGLKTFIDRLSFMHILLIWVFVVLCFGMAYYFFSGASSHLIYTADKSDVGDISDSIYFSFVTATTTGFGDILPSGSFKVIVIFEVLAGLLLLALVTSKLVSIKQDVILTEIYEISFNEKMNRMRSSLLLFRQNLSRVISNIDSGNIRKRELSDLYIPLSSFDDILNEILSLFTNSGKNHFTKKVDSLNAELILNSIVHSLDKLSELISFMNNRKLEWKREVTANLITKCITITDKIFEKIASSKSVPEKTMSDIKVRKSKIIESLQAGLIAGKDKITSKSQKDLKGFIEI
ncbi:MAG: potassium channel family protein, partial [Nanoarchaeota archaeon]|nr:potassium channel family protein [Nanoarchaeota archaeon]